MDNFQPDGRNKNFLNKNKTLKLYKQKRSKIELLKKEVDELQNRYDQINSQAIKTFDDFPLSEKTRKGLRAENYVIPTEIQKDSIGFALQGHDILGAAKTGSGKTLAFIIPAVFRQESPCLEYIFPTILKAIAEIWKPQTMQMLESLYCAGWTILDGLGAIVITPTRELAYQIYEVLNRIGVHHHFSVALVIGGKDLAIERKLLDKCNILICTPGRLKHHLDKNPLLNCMNMKILILDEADRILDLGFQKDMNDILEHLPTSRQTLLYSATQTKSVRDLARLSLKNPVYVSVHEHAKYSTPEGLRQNYIVVEAHLKMNLIWSFIKSHKQQKILIFMATCKQVKYTFESVCRLRPGISIMALYGTLHQQRRMKIYDEFCRKTYAVLFATDIASRGLDFPNINWVVQLDCPEDTNTYIHRAGRTARYEKNGESLLVLLPSEKESMVKQLKTRKIPIEELEVNPSKFYDVRRKLEAICARDVEHKYTAQRAFRAYLKNIYMMKDKTVFDVSKINIEMYSKSLGLLNMPRIRYLEKHFKIKSQAKRAQSALFNGSSASDSEDDLLKPKGLSELPDDSDSDLEEPRKLKKPVTKAAIAKRILKKKIKANTIIKFDEDGNPIREVCGQPVPVVAAELQHQIMEEGYSIEKAKELKEKEEQVDKLLYKERVKLKHREERLKMKKKRDKNEVPVAQLASDDENERESESDIDPNSIMLCDRSEEDCEVDTSEDSGRSESGCEVLQKSRKRKKEPSNHNVKRQKRDVFSAERPLDVDEELALHFLSVS